MTKNLNRIILIVLLLASTFVRADELDYPCRALIESGSLSAAKSELQQQQAKSPNDHAVAFALYKFYATRGNPDRNLKKAYACLCQSQDLLEAYPPKDLSRAEKNGYTAKLYAAEYANISLIAQLEAQRANTLESWNDYLATYKRAPQKLTTQVTKTRDAMAFKQAEKTNTREAYEEFTKLYPNAHEREEAEQRIYALAYNAIVESDKEQDFLDYIKAYPGSPYIDKAKDKATELEMRRLVRRWDWQTQKDYLQSHTAANRWRDTTMFTLMRYVKRTHDLEAARWGLTNLPAPHSDSCWAVMRAVSLEDTTLQAFVKFHDSYRTLAIESIQKADDKLIEAHNKYQAGSISTEQYIDLVAPAYPAYYKLQGLIRSDVKAKNWQAALATVKAHERAFGKDYRYTDLVRVLEEKDDPKRVATSVGSGVNTPEGNEYAPAITADDKLLYFCGTKRPGNMGKEDIFVSQKTVNGWGKAVPVTDLNTADANEASLAVTADGTTMIIFKNGKLMFSHRTKDGWGPLRSFSKTTTISEWQADAMITSDGKALLFAAMSKVPHENQMSINIFVSLLKENGEWSKPFGLGPVINTSRTDRSPFLHPDMKTLYFCSEGHSSMGGTDVFVSKRLSERSWTEWSEPVNMGKAVNSAGNECWYKISTDGSLAYFSKRENKQNDIYQLSIPEHLRPQPVATISGRVVDSNGNPVVTVIRWENLETQRFVGHTRTNPEDGQFFIALPEGKNYGYYIYNEKLFPVSDNIDLRKSDQFISVENNITVTTIKEMIENETPIALNNLFFDTGKWFLLPASISELNRVATIIRQQGIPVEISGHTDDVGDDESNRILSERRANAVRDYLLKAGIDSKLLTAHGYGESRPVATNKTPEGRQKNRRVELKFISSK